MFDDSRTATWVLDTDGAPERVNEELDAEMQAAWEAVRTEYDRRDVT